MAWRNREVCAILLVTFVAQIGCIVEARSEVRDSNEDVPWIECYHCNSEYDPRCGDPFESYSIGKVNCSLIEPLEHLQGLQPKICRKNVQKIYGKIRVVRGCGYLTDENLDAKKCLYRSGTSNVFAHYCSCTGNLCNSADFSMPAKSILMLSFLTMAVTL